MTCVRMEMVADLVEPPAPGMEGSAPAQERVDSGETGIIAKSKNKQTKSRAC